MRERERERETWRLYVVKEMVESDGTLKNPMEQRSSWLLSSNPECFQRVMAFVIISLVEERDSFLKVPVLFIIAFFEVVVVSYDGSSTETDA